MDSQQQYEALLADWGYENTMAADYARREKRIRQLKALVAFFKSIVTSAKKNTVHNQDLAQA